MARHCLWRADFGWPISYVDSAKIFLDKKGERVESGADNGVEKVMLTNKLGE